MTGEIIRQICKSTYLKILSFGELCKEGFLEKRLKIEVIFVVVVITCDRE